jgi:hypothetical protein
MLDCPAWIVLPPAAKVLWLDLRRQLNSFNNGDICCALSVLRKRGWTSTSKLARSKFALIGLGFIAVTRPGGFAMGKHVPTLFRFTDVETHEIPKLRIGKCAVTNEYLSHSHQQGALEAMAQAVQELHKQACGRRHKSETEVPHRNLASSESEAVKPFTKSRTGINGRAPDFESEPGRCGSNHAKERANQRSSTVRTSTKQKPSPSSDLEHLT